MIRQQSLLTRIEALEQRNRRVELEKAWETSWERRLAIMILTYAIVAIYLQFVVRINPWVNALVPVLGFLLSTLTISALKKYWIRRK